MSGGERQKPHSGVLKHPLRQALFVLLTQREASATELQNAVKQPLGRVTYHLGVLAKEGFIQSRQDDGGLAYGANALIPLGEPDIARILMLTFLDAAWAAVGELPSGLTLTPLLETMPVDVIGFVEASDVLKQALAEIHCISRVSEQRCRLAKHATRHRIVAVASLASGDMGSGTP